MSRGESGLSMARYAKFNANFKSRVQCVRHTLQLISFILLQFAMATASAGLPGLVRACRQMKRHVCFRARYAVPLLWRPHRVRLAVTMITTMMLSHAARARAASRRGVSAASPIAACNCDIFCFLNYGLFAPSNNHTFSTDILRI